MKRETAEQMILSYMKEIGEIIKEYYPKDDYITLTIMGDTIFFNNSYWEHPDEGVINYSIAEKHSIDNI